MTRFTIVMGRGHFLPPHPASVPAVIPGTRTDDPLVSSLRITGLSCKVLTLTLPHPPSHSQHKERHLPPSTCNKILGSRRRLLGSWTLHAPRYSVIIARCIHPANHLRKVANHCRIRCCGLCSRQKSSVPYPFP